jgi:hypothetical protein
MIGFLAKTLRGFGRGLRNGLVALGALAFVGTSIGVADYLATQPGSGTNFASIPITVSSTLAHYAAMLLCDPVAGKAQCAGVNSAGQLVVYLGGSGLGMATGSATSGALGSMVNCASTTTPAGVANGQQNYLNCDPGGPLRTTNTAVANGGATPFHLIAAASDNATSVKTTPGTVYSVEVGGLGSVPAYLKFYDIATAPTCGSTAVKKTIIIPAAPTAADGAGNNIPIPVGVFFGVGIGICVTAGIADTDDTSVAATTWNINFDYK